MGCVGCRPSASWKSVVVMMAVGHCVIAFHAQCAVNSRAVVTLAVSGVNHGEATGRYVGDPICVCVRVCV